MISTPTTIAARACWEEVWRQAVSSRAPAVPEESGATNAEPGFGGDRPHPPIGRSCRPIELLRFRECLPDVLGNHPRIASTDRCNFPVLRTPRRADGDPLRVVRQHVQRRAGQSADLPGTLEKIRVMRVKAGRPPARPNSVGSGPLNVIGRATPSRTAPASGTRSQGAVAGRPRRAIPPASTAGRKQQARSRDQPARSPDRHRAERSRRPRQFATPVNATSRSGRGSAGRHHPRWTAPSGEVQIDV